MKLILDEWIIREVIDTLYMARTTFLGVTELDSPQEVAKKSANETAITRRISKAIDIIQQSEQQSLPEELEEAAEKYRRESYSKSILPNIDGPMPEYGGSIKDAFKAGAEWQKEIDRSYFLKCYEQGKKDMKEQMLKEAKNGYVSAIIVHNDGDEEHYAVTYPNGERPHSITDKVKIIIL